MDWSDIADYLLDEIVVRLDSYSDYVRLRAVCPVWKSSLPKIPKYLPLTLPGLMLPCNHTDSEVFNLFFAASEVHKLKLAKTEQWLWKGSSKGWLVQLENSPSINLINPLTSTRMQLPPLTTFPNVLEYIPERIGAEYSVMTVNMREEEIRFFSLAEMKHFCVKKLVLSSSPRGKNCLAMAIYGDRDELAWCRIGDEGWKTVEGGWCFFDDIIHFDGKFYALDYIGRVIILPDEEVGASCPKATLFASPPNPDRPDFISDYFYLVESSGQLLMVDRLFESSSKSYNTVKFKVFGLNVNNVSSPWSKVKSLGDRMLFVGQGESFSMSSRDLPCLWKENRIYFTDDCNRSFDVHVEFQEVAGSDMGVFSLEDKRLETLPLPPGYEGCRRRVWPPPIWITPNYY